MLNVSLNVFFYSQQGIKPETREDGSIERVDSEKGASISNAKEAKQAARQNERLQKKIGDLFEHRHLFVAHQLSPAERRMLQRITRGLPHLRTLREIMDEVYRLFDRRCRTHTALAKLARLRRRVRRFRPSARTSAFSS